MDVLRSFLHVLAASVWVGGQLSLAAMLPTLRSAGEDVPRDVARAFNRIAWPAFAVLVTTGIWHLLTVLESSSEPDGFHPWFEVKFLLVLISGAGAALHIKARTKAGLAIGGAMSSLGSVAALLLGFVIRS